MFERPKEVEKNEKNDEKVNICAKIHNRSVWQLENYMK